MNNLKIKLLTLTALLGGVILLTNCGAAPSNTAASNSKPADALKTTEAPKTTDAPKTETASTDSVGVAECDEYIKKYEACLTKIAAKAPQMESSMQPAFKAQRDGFKQAAANPASKATLASTCKQAMDAVKQSTSMYACEW